MSVSSNVFIYLIQIHWSYSFKKNTRNAFLLVLLLSILIILAIHILILLALLFKQEKKSGYKHKNEDINEPYLQMA